MVACLFEFNQRGISSIKQQSFHFQVTTMGEVTISVLKLMPSRELHGRQISCQAENPMVIRPAVQDIVTLDVSCKTKVNIHIYISNMQ